jgi:lipopolysaccharide transport system permease protein
MDLIRHLVWRDFNLRYKRSFLGVLWSMVLPLAQLLVLVFLFQTVVPLNIQGYPVFVFCALLPWSWFSSSVSSACNLFVSNRDLVRHPNFVPARLMVMNTLSNFITYLFALPILCIVLAIYGFPFTPALLVLPVLLLIQGVLINGLSLIVATLNVFYRDVQHIVSVGLTLLFYLTPVFYRSQAVVERYQALYDFSPIAALIQAYRAAFFYGVAPTWPSVAFAAVYSFAIYGLGYGIFRLYQHEIIDVL